jgi:rhodanese-related sulfurtransferase/DNA-binding transcriptional ArsR family regulator
MATDTAAIKAELYQHFARVTKALASPRRLELLEALAQGQRNVEQLAVATHLPMANVSHHLQILRNGGLVTCQRDGVQVIYSLTDETEVHRIMTGIRLIAETHLAEVDRLLRRIFSGQDEIEPAKPEDLMATGPKNSMFLIDVRPLTEYAFGHIEGARSMPLDELPDRMNELPRDRDIVAYCRGPYCLMALKAVEKLRSEGFRARRLEVGFPEWKAAKYPVSAGN